MAASVRLRSFVARVQSTGSTPAPAQVRLRGFTGTLTSGSPPITAAARVRLRSFAATLQVGGGPIVPDPAAVRLRGFSAKLLPQGVPPVGSVRTGAWAKRGGVLVPVKVYGATDLP
jgi:hypothetical protein